MRIKLIIQSVADKWTYGLKAKKLIKTTVKENLLVIIGRIYVTVFFFLSIHIQVWKEEAERRNGTEYHNFSRIQSLGFN